MKRRALLQEPEARLLREIAATEGKRALRRALFRARLEVAYLRPRRHALQLFHLPGYVLSLPDGHPRRWIAARVVLYVGLGVILLAAVLRLVHAPRR